MHKDEREFLWCEAYRPHKIEDCILPGEQKKYFSQLVKKGEVQNMLLCGAPGTGKTTVARAICDELDLDYIMINGSEESGIDVLRTKIKQFASSLSLTGKTKVVIIDEADYLSAAFQAAFRSFLEEFSSNCRFILTANFKDRLIPALHSRCSVVEFKIPKSEKQKLAAGFFSRLIDILENENIEYTEPVLVKVVEKFFPDYRRALNELQKHSISGKIDESVLVNLTEESIKQLTMFLKDKDWKKMRQWVVNNIDKDTATLLRAIYDHIVPLTDHVPQLVMILADYQYKAAFVADQEINMVACMTEIMSSVDLK